MADDSTDSAFGFILFILFLALLGSAAGRGVGGGGGRDPGSRDLGSRDPGSRDPGVPVTPAPVTPAPSTLRTQLIGGQAAITINPPSSDVPAGPQTAPATMDMVFNAARTRVAVANFVPIVSPPFQTSQGMNTTTVSLQSGGNGPYIAGTGYMQIDLVLFFDNSVDVIVVDEDATLQLQLTTNPPGGRAVDAAGNVVLAGRGTFQGGLFGPLNDKTADVRLTGQIKPHP